MRLRLETENKTLVEVLYKKGLHTEVFAIGVAYQGDNHYSKLVAHIKKEEAKRLIAMLTATLSEF